jgi:hypothetical protein
MKERADLNFLNDNISVDITQKLFTSSNLKKLKKLHIFCDEELFV